MTDKVVERAEWEWFDHAGHLCVSQWCRFHLTTKVGDYLVSTVGEYWPDRDVRRITAECTDPSWLDKNAHRKGDDFDHAYMQRFGFDTIGAGEDSLYETMVFYAPNRCTKKGCGCGMPIPDDWGEKDGIRYATADAATRGHYEFCEKWADPNRRVQEEEE